MGREINFSLVLHTTLKKFNVGKWYFPLQQELHRSVYFLSLCKWSHIVYSLLCLAYFTQHIFVRFFYTVKCLLLKLLFGILLYEWLSHILLNHFHSVWWIFALFPISSYYTLWGVVMYLFHAVCKAYAYICLVYILRREMASS